MAYFRASSANRWAYFRASIGNGAAYSVGGDGRGAGNSQGDRLAAAVVRPSRTGCTGLLSHPFTNPPFHSNCLGRAEQEEVVRSGRDGSTGAAGGGERWRAVEGGLCL